MGFKKFITKQALRLKGVSSDKADEIAKQLDENPQLAESLIEEKKKGGLGEQYAAVLVMGKYKAEIMKHREALAPLMNLMQK